MELALYCPVCGFYEKEEDTIGCGGDYFTSVSVGSLFGELLACQFAEWLEEEGTPQAKGGAAENGAAETMQIVEAGAHRGELAKDILAWMREQRPALFQRLEYCLVEPSAPRRDWQQQRLAEFAGKVRWVGSLPELAAPPPSPLASSACHGGARAARPSPGLRGLIFSNELLDAMPVHRLGWDAAQRIWFEWGVALDEGRFVWTRMADDESKVQSPELLVAPKRSDGGATLSNVLPDGFILEVCPAAVEWWRQAAAVLASGRLLTIDYGLTASEFLVPERKDGTLRAYRQHRLGRCVLTHPGEQDITAHVNFTAIQEAGEGAGLKTEAFQTQAQFLTGIAARIWKGETPFGEWTPERTRQFQTLTHPEHLGRPFRVLLQSRRP